MGEDEDDGLLMDLSDMLNPTAKSSKRVSADNDENSDDDDEIDGGEDGDADPESMRKLVLGLDGKLEPRMRRKHNEVAEAYDESEFNLTVRGNSLFTGGELVGTKLKLDALVSSAKENRSLDSFHKQLNKFKQVAEAIMPQEAPLQWREKEQLSREAAFAKVNKDISEWTEVINKNRKADQLVFPVEQPKPVSISSSAILGHFKPETTLEKEISGILGQSVLHEGKQEEIEGLEAKKITPEELEARSAELAQLRSLMFYKELKQRRIAKIKSKTYRKLRRGKTGMPSVEELALLDPERAKKEILKLEAARIKERITMKHKNTGKWAKNLKGHKDENTRKALMEQIEKNRELTRKIAGVDSDDDEYDVYGTSEENAEAEALRQLDELQKDILEETPVSLPKKGIFAMKFMQRNLSQQMEDSKREIEAAKVAVREKQYGFEDAPEDAAPPFDESQNAEEALLSNDDSSDSDGDGEEKHQSQKVGVVASKQHKARTTKSVAKLSVGNDVGRMTFRPSDVSQSLVPESPDGEAFAEENAVDGFSIAVSGPVSIAAAKTTKHKDVIALEPLFEVEEFTTPGFSGTLKPANFEEKPVETLSPTASHSSNEKSAPAGDNSAASKTVPGSRRELKKPNTSELVNAVSRTAVPPSTLNSLKTKHNIVGAAENQNEEVISDPSPEDAWLDPSVSMKKQSSSKNAVPKSQQRFSSAAAFESGLEKVGLEQKKRSREEQAQLDASVSLSLSDVRMLESAVADPLFATNALPSAQAAPTVQKDADGKKRKRMEMEAVEAPSNLTSHAKLEKASLGNAKLKKMEVPPESTSTMGKTSLSAEVQASQAGKGNGQSTLSDQTMPSKSGKKKRGKKKGKALDSDNQKSEVVNDTGKTDGRSGKPPQAFLWNDDGPMKLVHSSDVKTLSRADLLKLAFSNDKDVVKQFEARIKKPESVKVAETPKQTESGGLPGWGNWGGANLLQKAPEVVTNQKKRRPGKRRKLVHIAELKNPNMVKYVSSKIPFGFETREQYEETLRMPLGREWNSTIGYNALTAPRIVTKMGRIIEPLVKGKKL
ncbi:Utp14 protein-domain-containing protein [Zopfochytrium polystomum]|nr:Utp14 protein-domain-containing protein [Zopfochytrium polystomum]